MKVYRVIKDDILTDSVAKMPSGTWDTKEKGKKD
jgi:hypothetical protein